MDAQTSVQLVSTLVVAVATAVLAYLTYRNVQLTNKMVTEMRAARAPYIFVELEIRKTGNVLAVGNSGQTAAVDIHFDVKQDASWVSLPNMKFYLNQTAPIEKGITYLPPGRTLRYLLGQLNVAGSQEGDAIKLGVQYKDDAGELFRREIVIALATLEGLLYETYQKPESEIAEALKDMRRESMFGRLT